MANCVEPDQTAPIGAVCSGSTLFASILNSSVMLSNYLQLTTSAEDIFKCFFSCLLGIFPALMSPACADPEGFVRGGPTLTAIFSSFFWGGGVLVDEERDYPNTNTSGPTSAHQRNAISVALRWRTDGGPALSAALVAL